jgi:hypothetical protein
MNFRNRSHIISPAAAFKLHFKVADVLGILGRAHLHLRFFCYRRSGYRLSLTGDSVHDWI